MPSYLMVYIVSYTAHAGEPLRFLRRNGIQYQFAKVRSEEGEGVQEELVAVPAQAEGSLRECHAGEGAGERLQHLGME